MISKGNHVKFARFVLLAVSKNMTLIFFRSMYNKTVIRFGFCDIQNNRGLGKGYQPKPKASIILDITKTSSNNCLNSDKTFILTKQSARRVLFILQIVKLLTILKRK